MQGYSLANILLLLLATSFLASQNHVFVNARKLAKSESVFSINLIHRDSPQSPYYDPSITPQERLKRAPFGSISRGHKIHLSPVYYHTQNKGELSSLTPSAGNYLIKIGLGTPQVEVIAGADTGSDLIWTQCAQCSPCLPQKAPFYDPTKSSTFNTINWSSPTCSSYPDITTVDIVRNSTDNSNSTTSLCGYEIGYVEGSQSIGLLATDTITLPSTHGKSISLPSSVFGCGIAQISPYDTAGLVGLGSGPASLVSQLGPKINYKFSYCLTPLTSGVNGKLTFGSSLRGPGLVSTPFTTGQDPPTFYYITLDGITVGIKDSPVQVPVNNDVVIDSGTTLTYLPTSVYGSIKAAMIKGIHLSPVPSPLQSYDLCYNTSSVQQLNPPDLVFHFKGADVVLKEINTFRDLGDGFTCLALVASDDNFIFGNIAQVNFQVQYDLKAKQVSFAPADCATH